MCVIILSQLRLLNCLRTVLLLLLELVLVRGMAYRVGWRQGTNVLQDGHSWDS